MHGLLEPLGTLVVTADGTTGVAGRADGAWRSEAVARQRLIFTRWLYETGRLTEWEVRYEFNRQGLERLAFMHRLHEHGRLHDG
jgi:hypothetical protein